LKLLAVLAILISMTSLSSMAGNGVERGRLIVGEQHFLGTEIKNFISKKMVHCLENTKKDYLQVKGISIEEDEVDQGIVDLYYTVDMLHKNEKGNILNEVSVEIEDADYSNWKKYEEKLSIKVLKDTNQLCR